jgi:hypothetical protein
MNRESATNTIRLVDTQPFRSEISYYMELDREDDSYHEDGRPYDELDAIFDYQRVLEDYISDNPEPKFKRDYQNQLKFVRTVLIDLGFYRPIYKEEMDSIISTGPKYNFKMNGVHYTSDYTEEEWIEMK